MVSQVLRYFVNKISTQRPLETRFSLSAITGESKRYPGGNLIAISRNYQPGHTHQEDWTFGEKKVIRGSKARNGII